MYTVLGVLIGGILALAGQFLTARREREKWKRDEQNRFRQELFDIYSNCLALLSTIIVDCRLNPGEAIVADEQAPESIRWVRESLTEDEKLHRNEALRFLWLLLLHLKDSNEELTEFESDIQTFAEQFHDSDQPQPYYLRQR